MLEIIYVKSIDSILAELQNIRHDTEYLIITNEILVFKFAETYVCSKKNIEMKMINSKIEENPLYFTQLLINNVSDTEISIRETSDLTNEIFKISSNNNKEEKLKAKIVKLEKKVKTLNNRKIIKFADKLGRLKWW